jgi:hypothetical protein
MEGRLADAQWEIDRERERIGLPRREIPHSATNPNVAKTEMEMSHGWMAANPTLAIDSIIHWSMAHRDVFDLKIDARRKGFTTFVATRKPKT